MMYADEQMAEDAITIKEACNLLRTAMMGLNLVTKESDYWISRRDLEVSKIKAFLKEHEA